MVSICCITYNHEKYIRQALDSFLMQKTNFKYEIIIHDDASTDSSADIIREYEKEYPDIIKPIYQKENKYSKDEEIEWKYVFPNAAGKYIALCESDDFFTDENKLQLQFDVMENNPQCSVCTHTVRWVSEKGARTKWTLPQKKMKEGYAETDEVIARHLFHTSSFFIRNTVIKDCIKAFPDFFRVFRMYKVNDVPTMLYCVSKGDVYFINREMSCYRMNSIGSWSEKTRNDENLVLLHAKLFIDGINSFNKYTDFVYDKPIREHIDWHERIIMTANGDYRNAIKTASFKLLSAKGKTYLILCAYAPKVIRLYRKVKYKNG